MRRILLIVAMVMAFTMGFWTFDVARSPAKKSNIGASAHVSGVVIGKPIHNQQDVLLGTVENIVLNDSGCAQYVILSGKFHGARSRLYPIPWTLIARTGPDVIFVDLDPAYLVEAPSFEAGRWPDFSQPQWQTEVRTFYEKRAERATLGETGKASGALRSEEKARLTES